MAVFVRVLVVVKVAVLVRVAVKVDVNVEVFVRVGVKVAESVGVLVRVKVGVLVRVSVGVFVRVFVGVKVGVLPWQKAPMNRTSSMAKFSAPLALLAHCRVETWDWLKGSAGFPKPRWAMALKRMVTGVQAAGAVKVAPQWSPVVTELLTNWNQ